MLNEVTQTQEDKYHVISLIVESKKIFLDTEIYWRLPEGKGMGGLAKWVKGVNYTMTDSNQIYCDNFIVYIKIEILCCIPKTNMLYTNFNSKQPPQKKKEPNYWVCTWCLLLHTLLLQ